MAIDYKEARNERNKTDCIKKWVNTCIPNTRLTNVHVSTVKDFATQVPRLAAKTQWRGWTLAIADHLKFFDRGAEEEARVFVLFWSSSSKQGSTCQVLTRLEINALRRLALGAR